MVTITFNIMKELSERKLIIITVFLLIVWLTGGDEKFDKIINLKECQDKNKLLQDNHLTNMMLCSEEMKKIEQENKNLIKNLLKEKELK